MTYIANQYIYLNEPISSYSNTEINVLANNNVGKYLDSLFDDNGNLIIDLKSNYIFGLKDSAISVLANSTIDSVSDGFDNSITSTTSIGTYTLNVYLDPAATASALQTGAPSISFNIDVDSIVSTLNISQLQALLETTIQSIDSGATLGTLDILLNISIGSISTTAQFGNARVDMEIDDPDEGTQLLPVTSTLQIGIPSVTKVIGTLSINSTTVLGLASFGDFIHRTLIFKNDNITKIGPSDSVEITHGITFNPASQNSNTASSGLQSLPNNPVGFITVTINGTNYKMPFYNE